MNRDDVQQRETLERCLESRAPLEAREHAFLLNCRARMDRQLALSEKQAKWLEDIAKRILVQECVDPWALDENLEGPVNLIQVITVREFSELHGRDEILVSHGVDLDTGRSVCLPCEPVGQFPGLLFDDNLGYYLKKAPPEPEPERTPTRPNKRF